MLYTPEENQYIPSFPADVSMQLTVILMQTVDHFPSYVDSLVEDLKLQNTDHAIP